MLKVSLFGTLQKQKHTWMPCPENSNCICEPTPQQRGTNCIRIYEDYVIWLFLNLAKVLEDKALTSKKADFVRKN